MPNILSGQKPLVRPFFTLGNIRKKVLFEDYSVPQPSVSVVVSTYNRLAFLKEAVNSVKTQTFKNWELIIVDDASSDGTEEWLNTIQHSQIKTIRLHQNSERSAARNRGLAEAAGAFIMFLDDDDRLRPNALQALVKPLQNDGNIVAVVGARWKFRDGYYATKISHPPIAFKKSIWQDLLTGWSAVSGQMLFRTATVVVVGGYSGQLIPCEDRQLWLRIACHGSVQIIPAIALDYRDHGQKRPGNIEAIREKVYQEFIDTIDCPHEKQQAQRMRDSARLLKIAETKYWQANYREAFNYYFRVCRSTPTLAISPLTGPPIIRGAVKSLFRSFLH